MKLWIDGDRLRYNAPKGVLTPTLRKELTERKEEIITFLRQAKIKASSSAPPLQPISRDGELPLSFTQERLWFLHQLEPDNPSYNVPVAVRIMGSLKISALQRCLNEIVRRHEVLRTTASTANGRPIQIIAPDLNLTLPVVDLRELPKDEQEVKVLRLAREEARRPFDLSKGPLLAAAWQNDRP